jgi:hypothetical protein
MSLADVREIPAPGADAEIVGQVRYFAGGHVATDIIKLVAAPEGSDLDSVLIAEDYDTGESSIAIGFADVDSGEATIAIDPRTSVAENNVAYLHDVVSMGKQALKLESVQVDAIVTPLSTQTLRMAGLVLAPEAIAA